MTITLIVKGAEAVIRLHQADADALYNFLEGYVSGKGLLPQFVDPREVIFGAAPMEQATYVIAHSRGTNVVLDLLKDYVPPCLEGIALLDPSRWYKEIWNEIRLPKVAIISTILGRPYAEGFDCAVHVRDDHYFTHSREQVRKGLDRVFGSGHPQ